ncbi:MAG TPA: SprT-like domain-containing protein [Flavobacteriales bacterium]|nr:SprT-like domain-containing protein [Flavobacteriales bacterium]
MREQYTRVLIKYIPETAVNQIVDWIINYGIHLKITRNRATKLGDFRPTPGTQRGHTITINHNLNLYAFLITLVHEIAHFSTWNTYHNRVKPHGNEWKQEFKKHMIPFLNTEVFPQEVLIHVKGYISNPAASSCVDEDLMRVLRLFDDEYTLVLEDIPANALFKLKTGRVFRKGEQRRKYFRCEELGTNKHYLVNPLAEVEPVAEAG